MRLVGLIVFTLFFSSCFAAKWTVLFYFNGDSVRSYSEYYYTRAINYMEKYLPDTSEVNFFVQFDRVDGWPSTSITEPDATWTGAKRLKIVKDSSDMTSNWAFTSEVLKDLGEVNMGDPNTLKDYLIWAHESFPADNYALFITKEGSEWQLTASAKRGTSIDDNTGSTGSTVLSANAIYQALKAFSDAKSRKIDVVVLDGSFTNQIETAYEIKDYASYLVGKITKQEYVYLGYSYWFQNLAQAGASDYLKSPASMAAHINTADFQFQKALSDTTPTLNSVIPLSQMNNLKTALNTFMQNVAMNYNEKALNEAVKKSFKFGEWTAGKYDYCDILSLVRAIKCYMHFKPITDSAEKVEALLMGENYTSAETSVKLTLPVKIKIYSDPSETNIASPSRFDYIFKGTDDLFKWSSTPEIKLVTNTSASTYLTVGPGISNITSSAPNRYIMKTSTGWLYSFTITPTTDHSYCPSTDAYKYWEDSFLITATGRSRHPLLMMYPAKEEFPYWPVAGLTVYFPNYSPTAGILSEYGKFAFAKDTYFDELIAIISGNAKSLMQQKCAVIRSENFERNSSEAAFLYNEIFILASLNSNAFSEFAAFSSEYPESTAPARTVLKEFFYQSDSEKYRKLAKIQ